MLDTPPPSYYEPPESRDPCDDCDDADCTINEGDHCPCDCHLTDEDIADIKADREYDSREWERSFGDDREDY